MEIRKVNLEEKLDLFSDYWSPKIVAALNGQQIKLVKCKGDFDMHHHESEDELFYVIDGKLFIELDNETLELNPGELVVIPKGVQHRPFAPEEVHVMLFEPASTLNTGNVNNNLTVSELDQI